MLNYQPSAHVHGQPNHHDDVRHWIVCRRHIALHRVMRSRMGLQLWKVGDRGSISKQAALTSIIRVLLKEKRQQ